LILRPRPDQFSGRLADFPFRDFDLAFGFWERELAGVNVLEDFGGFITELAGLLDVLSADAELFSDGVAGRLFVGGISSIDFIAATTFWAFFVPPLCLRSRRRNELVGLGRTRRKLALIEMPSRVIKTDDELLGKNPQKSTGVLAMRSASSLGSI